MVASCRRRTYREAMAMYTWANLGASIGRGLFALLKADSSPCVQDAQWAASPFLQRHGFLCYRKPKWRRKRSTALCYHRVD